MEGVGRAALPRGESISLTRAAFLGTRRLFDLRLRRIDNRDRTWRERAGWRVNDDAPLLGLAGRTMAPYATWSSDGSIRPRSPRLRQDHGERT